MRHRALHSNSFSLTLLQGKPQYSIANSYAIGPAMYGDEPQPTDFLVHYEGDAEPTTMRMRDVRSVEWQLVSLVRTRGELVTYAGGAQKGITGNINAMSHDLDALVTTVLPHATVNMKGACCVAAFLLLVTCVSLRCVPVYLTGKLTPVQKALVTKEYSVRRDVIRGLLQWLVANNHFYADIQLSDANLDGLNGDREGAPLPGTLIQDHDATEPAAQPSSHIDATIPEEQATRLSHTLLSEPTTPAGALPVIKQLDQFIALAVNRANGARDQRVIVRNGDYIRLTSNGNIMKAFVKMFPFGRGGPSDGQGSRGRLKKALRNYLRLSSNRFDDPYWVLAAYQMASSQEAVHRSFVYAKSKPTAVASFGGTTVAQMRTARNWLVSCECARKTRLPQPPRPPTAGAAIGLLSQVAAAHSTMPHTTGYAGKERKRAISMTMGLGPGSLFVTLSPNDNNDALRLRLVYPGGTADITRSQRFTSVSSHPLAAALAFKVIVDTFMWSGVGWDVKQGKPRPGGGVFGTPLAYHGCVEAQGRGSLHVHLVRDPLLVCSRCVGFQLSNCGRVNTAALDRRLFSFNQASRTQHSRFC